MKRLILMLCVGMLISCLAASLAYTEERSVTIKQKRDLSVEARKSVDTALQNAKYYALIIGNNNYKHLPKLMTAVTDAKDVEKLLKNRCGFETKLLLDATRADILDGINEMREKVGERGNLLIYLQDRGDCGYSRSKGKRCPCIGFLPR